MSEKTIVYFRGNGNWDAAFETIVDAFKTVNAFIAKQGLRPNGPAMTIYTATDDTSFSFQAAVPVVELPKEAPRGEIRHVQGMYVELNGKPVQLSPGAQIRDTDNRLVLPTSLVEKFDVRYQLDGAGLVHRVWIMTPLEREQAPPLPQQPVTLPDAKS